ncbi:hypothetical protein SVIO_072440 [Streptomyces violaceusniger]|uniref:DUF2399 domain-containing protein n=1 Tax=Streptomyces violaceusniger TaxID=68280 RepID=A0A4D4L4T5_STRVO|nr:hypothetical protein SVIO_072440 [Streptomyces violaceusniger]
MVHICENPTVLATAADTYGPACPPLICLQGQPSAAALTLLRHLHANRAKLLYHVLPGASTCSRTLRLIV